MFLMTAGRWQKRFNPLFQNNMNHKQLIAFVSKRSGICPATVERVLPACFQIIRETLVTGEHHGSVLLPSFGTFYAQNRKINVADPKHPGQRIQGYRLTPRFLPTAGFRDDVEREQVSPDVRCFEESCLHEKPRPPRNRKYHFRTEEAKQRMREIGRANNYHILRAKQMHLDRAQDTTNVRQPETREAMRKKKEANEPNVT